MNMFRKKCAFKGHDRYAIYRLVGRTVGFVNPRRKTHHVKGVVADVSRDIFEDAIEVGLEDGKSYLFKEPNAILKDGPDVVLVYGDPGLEPTDKETFKSLEERSYKEPMEETLKRTARTKRKDARICVLEDDPGRRKRKHRR